MKIKKLKAVGHRVLVRLVDFRDTEKAEEYTFNAKTGNYEKLSEGGFVLDTKSKTQYMKEQERQQYAMEEAEVVQLGPTAYKAFDDGQPWCKVGDFISMPRYAGGQDYKVGEEYFRFILDSDVIGVIEFE